MIHLKDLRLGNLVKDEEGNVREVSAIICNNPPDRLVSLYSGSAILNDGLFQNEMFLQPIELTEEILSKNGFELAYKLPKGKHFKIKIKGNVKFVLYMPSNVYQWSMTRFYFYSGFGGLNIHIRYVHELQNIFYDMTKTDLKLDI